MFLKSLAMIASATALMFGLAAGAPSPLSAAPMGVTGHSWDAIASANAGMDGIEHIWSVGYTSITDLKKRHQADAIRKPGMYLESQSRAAASRAGDDTIGQGANSAGMIAGARAEGSSTPRQ